MYGKLISSWFSLHTDTVSDQGDEINKFPLSNADHIETGQTRIYKYGTKQKYINLIYYKRITGHILDGS